jgi:hypothetical protein
METGNEGKASVGKRYQPPSSLRELMAATKGNIKYQGNESFLLHVFWEAPSTAAAMELLSGLQKCATATHRDTPCVPTYFFRVSTNDTALCTEVLTVGDHPQLAAAKKKIERGASIHAVHAELRKRRIDLELLDQPDAALLPESQQLHPVAVELTEIYLDERAFMEHAGSRDYLDGYSTVMNPAMHNRTPQTIRLGTPCENIVEKILEPILHEHVVEMPPGCSLWRCPTIHTVSAFLSLDFALSSFGGSAEATVAALPEELRVQCTSCVAFPHPLREDTLRVMIVLSQLPSVETLGALAALRPCRGEIHLTSAGTCTDTGTGTAVSAAAIGAIGVAEGPGNEREHSQQTSCRLQQDEEMRVALQASGLGDVVLVGVSACAGYALHSRAAELVCEDDAGVA